MSAPYKIALPYTWSINSYSGTIMWPPILLTDHTEDEMKDWCKTYVGPNKWNYFGMYKPYRFVFHFKQEEDLLAFKLKFINI